MAPTNKHQQFLEIFGEYAEVTDNNEARLKSDFVGSDREKSLLNSEDASMLSVVFCSLPRTYAFTVVARTASKDLSPSYIAYAIATVRVLTKNIEELDKLFQNGVANIAEEASFVKEDTKNN